jgi:hypothetical protein
MAQVVEHLLRKCKALSSNPSTTTPSSQKKELNNWETKIKMGARHGGECL